MPLNTAAQNTEHHGPAAGSPFLSIVRLCLLLSSPGSEQHALLVPVDGFIRRAEPDRTEQDVQTSAAAAEEDHRPHDGAHGGGGQEQSECSVLVRSGLCFGSVLQQIR